MYTIGIDPGLTGSVAILDASGSLHGLADTPTLTLRVQRGTRHVYDAPGLVALLQPYASPHSHVWIEESQAMPGQGSRSMFTIGLGYGLWLGILASLQMSYTTVRPHVWKRSLALGKDKEASRLRAIQLFPGAELRRKKDHGRAEALLLAYYGCQQRRVTHGCSAEGG